MEKAAERGKELEKGLPGIVFMGTPDFALPSLERLAAAGILIPMVVTQPDRPRGRGKRLSPPPVKVLAEELSIPVYQPESVREKETLEQICAAGAEWAAVVAYGQILPKAFLESFPLGVLNVHASLLPRHRGAAPIHRSILDGDQITGISIMLLDQGMDTGPVLSQRETPIGEVDTFGTMHDKLAGLGAELLHETLIAWAAGRIRPCPQNEALATYAPPVAKEELRIDWSRSARSIANRVRAFDPWPGAYTSYNGKRIKLFGVSLFPLKSNGKPGEVLGHSESGFLVLAGDGQVVSFRELQMEGQRRLAAESFLRGRPISPGSLME
jgi:methionyl-tRNA formyltransferase